MKVMRAQVVTHDTVTAIRFSTRWTRYCHSSVQGGFVCAKIREPQLRGITTFPAFEIEVEGPPVSRAYRGTYGAQHVVEVNIPQASDFQAPKTQSIEYGMRLRLPPASCHPTTSTTFRQWRRWSTCDYGMAHGDPGDERAGSNSVAAKSTIKVEPSAS